MPGHSHGSDLTAPLLKEEHGHGHSHAAAHEAHACGEGDCKGHAHDDHGHSHNGGTHNGHGHDEEQGHAHDGHGDDHGHSHKTGGHDHGHAGHAGHGHDGHSHDSEMREKRERDPYAEDKRKLKMAVGCALFFMLVETIGGVVANSLAIITDAAHMLSDVSGFAVSIFALSLSERVPDVEYSYGYKQAEVLGAMLSVMVVWGLVCVLLWEAVPRLFHPEPVDGPVMCVISFIGLLVNLVLMKVLGHGHDHGHDGHGHSHGHSHGHGCHGDEQDSAALQAAMAHVIGDAVQSLGVLLASALIWFRPFDNYVGETEDGVSRWNYMDPLCTVAFSFMVLTTTKGTVKRTLKILMCGTPGEVATGKLQEELELIENVTDVHDLHVWSMGSKEVLCTAHLVVQDQASMTRVLKAAVRVAKGHGIEHATFQLEIEGHFPLAPGSPMLQKQKSTGCGCAVWEAV